MLQSLKPLENGFLPVSDIHRIHYMTFGNKNGIPLINFHGGPGSGTTPKIAAAIDQNKYYIILFDQRGCGQSVPHGEIKDNNTDMLIRDADKLLEHLGVNKVVVTGGSWGSALAIKYAETFPGKVLGVMVYAVCLFRKEDILWYVKNAEMLFPEWLENIYQCTHTFNYKEFLVNYEKSTLQQKMEIVTVFFNYATAIGKGIAEPRYITTNDLTDNDLLSTRIFLHYLSNDYFVKNNEILEGLQKIKDIPTTIVHGRLDFSCPINGAYIMSNMLSNVDLYVLEQAGHFSPELRNLFFEKINNFNV